MFHPQGSLSAVVELVIDPAVEGACVLCRSGGYACAVTHQPSAELNPAKPHRFRLSAFRGHPESVQVFHLS